MTASEATSSIRELQKKYCSRALTMAIIIGFVCIILDYKPIGKGLLLGTLFSILNFILMGETLPMRLSSSKGKSFFLSFSSLGVRYILLAIPLYLGITSATYNFIAVALGIFSVQLVLLADHIINRHSNAYRKRSA